MYAVCKGHEEVVHALLEHPDIAVNAASNEEKTALMYAAERSFLPIVEALLEHPSIDVTLKDKVCCTFLFDRSWRSPNVF